MPHCTSWLDPSTDCTGTGPPVEGVLNKCRVALVAGTLYIVCVRLHDPYSKVVRRGDFW
jgi:hypothetical protein